MHASPPLEATPVKSYYYITDAQARLAAPTQQDAWLQKFNYSTLAVITSHEVMPGHYVHSVFMRQDAGQDPPHLDRPEPVPAAFVGAGRLGALRRADDGGRGFPCARSAIRDGADQRGADAHLPAHRRHSAAHRRVDRGSGGDVLRGEGAPAGARGPRRRPSAAPTTRPTAATSWARWRRSSCGPTTRRRRAPPSACASSTSG